MLCRAVPCLLYVHSYVESTAAAPADEEEAAAAGSAVANGRLAKMLSHVVAWENGY